MHLQSKECDFTPHRNCGVGMIYVESPGLFEVVEDRSEYLPNSKHTELKSLTITCLARENVEGVHKLIFVALLGPLRPDSDLRSPHVG